VSRLEYFRETPIAALSTATGGAISIVRVSGKNLSQKLSPLYPDLAANDLKDRMATRVRLVDPILKTPLDDSIVLPFFAPRSFTGEDVFEFHLHGGGFLGSRFLEVLIKLGINQALPGEFSFRAVRNGKMSIPQAQAVSDLISAQNDRAVELALENLSGVQNELLEKVADHLRQTLTLAEAGIDFSDQDIDEVGLKRLQDALINPKSKLEKLRDSFHRGVRIQEGIKLAIVGLPNAGKSSLFNALLGEERSIVSEIAGTTRDSIREFLTLRNGKLSLTFRIEDTAGLRSAEDEVEKLGVARTEKAISAAEIVIWVVDPHTSPESALELWPRFQLDQKKTLGVFTKADLGDSTYGNKFYSLLPEALWTNTSARTRAGITPLIEKILTAGDALAGRAPSEILLTRIEHFHAVENAIDSLTHAQITPDHVTLASDLRQTLHNLSPLIGETPTDAILEKIFSAFCIGK